MALRISQAVQGYRTQLEKDLKNLQNPDICKTPENVTDIFSRCSAALNSLTNSKESAADIATFNYVITHLKPYTSDVVLQKRLEEAPSPLVNSKVIEIVEALQSNQEMKLKKPLGMGSYGTVYSFQLGSVLGACKVYEGMGDVAKLAENHATPSVELCQEEDGHIALYGGYLETSFQGLVTGGAIFAQYDKNAYELFIGKEARPELFHKMLHDIARGMFYLHIYKNRIIGDLKLVNILYDQNTGSFAITDLDGSKNSSEDCKGLSIPEDLLTPPEYSPHNTSYTQALDIWYLGLNILDVLTQQRSRQLAENGKFDLYHATLRQRTTETWIEKLVGGIAGINLLQNVEGQVASRLAQSNNSTSRQAISETPAEKIVEKLTSIPMTRDVKARTLNRLETFDPDYQYLSLALDCLKTDPSARPNIQAILEKLADIEAFYLND